VEQLLQSGVAHEYEVFLSHVASGRRKTRDEVDAIAQGRVWAGSDAQRIGLVDRFGGYHDALDAAAKRASLPAGYRIKRIEPELRFVDRLLISLSDDSVASLAQTARALLPSAGGNLLLDRQWLQTLQPVSAELQRLQRYALARRPVAYCFCEAR
jgi:protease-4